MPKCDFNKVSKRDWNHWIKISAIMAGRRQKIKKKQWLKRPKAVPHNAKFGPKYELFKNSYLEFFFWKYYFGHTAFLYLSKRSSGLHHSRKPQNQQKLAKKITHFTIQFRSKRVTHFRNLNSLDIENNMLPQHSQI